jgi:hypothetical protein
LGDSQNYFTVIGITDGSGPVDNHNRKILEGLGPRADPPLEHKGDRFGYTTHTVGIRYTSLIFA